MADSQRPPGQPFTFSGVARYAPAGWAQVFRMALLFACLPAVLFGVFALRCWAPVITEAAAALPARLRLENGALQSSEQETRLLSANRFLALQLVLGQNSPEGSAVDIGIDLGRFDLGIVALLGEAVIPYPANVSLQLDRAGVMPFWGAWKVPLIAAFSMVVLAGLIATWLALGVVYAPLACLIGGLARKELTLGAAWKMCVAAQWPASLLMSFALGLYAAGQIGLLFIGIMFVAHFLPSLLNVIIAPLFLPKVERVKAAKSAKGSNPFSSRQKQRHRGKNPFRKTGSEGDEGD